VALIALLFASSRTNDKRSEKKYIVRTPSWLFGNDQLLALGHCRAPPVVTVHTLDVVNFQPASPLLDGLELTTSNTHNLYRSAHLLISRSNRTTLTKPSQKPNFQPFQLLIWQGGGGIISWHRVSLPGAHYGKYRRQWKTAWDCNWQPCLVHHRLFNRDQSAWAWSSE